MTQPDNKATILRARFAEENNIKVTNDWLVGCISFFLSQNPQMGIQELYRDAMLQFTLADLKEIGVSTLPDSVVNNTETHNLQGKFTLQMQYLIDISESPYEQHRKMHNIVMDEADENLNRTQVNFNKTKSKRNLKLELTDGFKTVTAMEYRPIPCLNTKLTPGTKILLHGPIKVVNKVLLLESKNVRVLGGEVDTLLITNAYENVLLKMLNKPLNPTPKLDYKEDPVGVEPPKQRNIQPIPMDETKFKRNNKTVKKPVVQVQNLMEDEDDDFLGSINLEALPELQNTHQTVAKRNVVDDFNDCDDDFELMLAMESEVMQEAAENRNIPSNTNFSCDDDDVMIQENLSSLAPIGNNLDFDDDDMLAEVNCNVTATPQSSTYHFDSNVGSSREESVPMTAPKNTVSSSCNSVPGNSNGSSNFTNFGSSQSSFSSIPPTSTSRSNSQNKEFVDQRNLETTETSSKNLQNKNPLNANKPKIEAKKSSAVPENEMEIDFHLNDEVFPDHFYRICDPEYPFKIGNANLATIDQLTSLEPHEKVNKYFVFLAGVPSFWHKLKVKNGEWKLGCFLKDEFSQNLLQVRLCSPIIVKMTGCEANEFSAMREHARTKPHLNEELSKIINNLKTSLESTTTYMKVSTNEREENPVVIEFIEPTASYDKTMTLKIKEENLLMKS